MAVSTDCSDAGPGEVRTITKISFQTCRVMCRAVKKIVNELGFVVVLCVKVEFGGIWKKLEECLQNKLRS